MDQAGRILCLYCRLMRRERLHIENVAMEYHITERSIARDFHTIRLVLSELHENSELLFDNCDKSYYLSRCGQSDTLSGMDIMALLKVLIGGRAFRRDELTGSVDTMRSFLSYNGRKELYNAIEDELKNYIEPLHHKPIIKMQWDLNRAIFKRQKICILYKKSDGTKVKREVLPVNIVFAEYYFYLVAFLDNEDYDYPAFFRIDRIESFDILGKIDENSRHNGFKYSDMASAVQFMYAGELMNIKLRCRKNALEAVLDRVPKHSIIEESGDFAIIEATVFGEGFMRWAVMQGKAVEILAPKELRRKIAENLRTCLASL